MSDPIYVNLSSSETEPKYFWQKLVLSLDKYINSKYKKIKDSFSLACGVALWLLYLMYCANKNIPVNVTWFFVFPVLLGLLFMRINKYSWSYDRYIQQVAINKQSYDCGCNLNNLKAFGESEWLESRLKEHYTCTVYSVISGIFLGWGFAALSTVAIVWML